MKKKYPQVIHVVDQLTNLMLGMDFATKYTYPNVPIIDVHIIDSFMAKEYMEMLELSNFGKTFTILYLSNQSTIKHTCIVEDILLFVDS